jgi:hypothetical protein
MARIHKIIESREVTKVEDVEIKALELTPEEAGLLADLMLYAVEWRELASIFKTDKLKEADLQSLFYKVDGLSRPGAHRPYSVINLMQVIDQKAVRRINAQR